MWLFIGSSFSRKRLRLWRRQTPDTEERGATVMCQEHVLRVVGTDSVPEWVVIRSKGRHPPYNTQKQCSLSGVLVKWLNRFKTGSGSSLLSWLENNESFPKFMEIRIFILTIWEILAQTKHKSCFSLYEIKKRLYSGRERQAKHLGTRCCLSFQEMGEGRFQSSLVRLLEADNAPCRDHTKLKGWVLKWVIQYVVKGGMKSLLKNSNVIYVQNTAGRPKTKWNLSMRWTCLLTIAA